MRNPKWERDELILALDLYFRHNPIYLSQKHEEVIKLSNILNKLPIYDSSLRTEVYRNPNGVYMKLCNFLRFDPSYNGIGLERGGKLEEMIWNEFSGNQKYLNKISQIIIDNIESPRILQNYDEEVEFPEGKIIFRIHRSYELNNKIVRKAKEIATEHGNLKCSICNFDFYKFYGELGKGYIECHHTLPLSQYGKVKTTIKDLQLVCSNCHKMLHRKRPWLSADELNQILHT